MTDSDFKLDMLHIQAMTDSDFKLDMLHIQYMTIPILVTRTYAKILGEEANHFGLKRYLCQS